MDTDQLPADMLAELEGSAPPPPTDALGRLSALAQEVQDIDARLEKGERIMAELNKRRYQILTRDMIDVMDETGVEQVSVAGQEYRTDTEYHASIPKERRDEAHDWLEQDGSGDLITRQLQVNFPKGCEEEANALHQYVRERYQMADVEMARAVPWKRLTSWVKEMYGTRELHMELLGARVSRIVRVPKAKRRSDV